MTQPVNAQAEYNAAQEQFTPAKLLFGSALFTGSGAGAAALFTTISPIGGAVFGVSFFLSNRLIQYISNKVDCFPDSNVAKVAKFVLGVLGGVAAASFITTAIGIPLTFSAGLILALGMGVVFTTSLLVLGGCLCSSAIATGIAMGRDDSGVAVRV